MKFLTTLLAFLVTLVNSSMSIKIQREEWIDNFILGGNEVFVNEYKFAVALRLQGNPHKSVCGGSIITRTTILTSALCLQATELLEALLGSHNIGIIEPNRQTIIATPNNFILHSQFNPVNSNFDIGAIRNLNIILNPVSINVIRLPPLGSQEQYLDALVLALGWGDGSNSRLHSFQTSVISNGFCETRFESGFVPPSALCTRGFLNRGPCRDEGGPLVTFDSQTRQHILIGVIAFAMCGIDYPDIHTRITTVRQWIALNTDIDN